MSKMAQDADHKPGVKQGESNPTDLRSFNETGEFNIRLSIVKDKGYKKADFSTWKQTLILDPGGPSVLHILNSSTIFRNMEICQPKFLISG